MNADKSEIEIILNNLITNAVKYNRDGGKVDVSLYTDGDKRVIKVSDTGIGVPEDAKPKMFSKLFRTDNAKEFESEGTGLGLYLVKSIVEKTGGKVWFDSTLGKGTTFYLALPFAGMKEKSGEKSLS